MQVHFLLPHLENKSSNVSRAGPVLLSGPCTPAGGSLRLANRQAVTGRPPRLPVTPDEPSTVSLHFSAHRTPISSAGAGLWNIRRWYHQLWQMYERLHYLSGDREGIPSVVQDGPETQHGETDRGFKEVFLRISVISLIAGFRPRDGRVRF